MTDRGPASPSKKQPPDEGEPSADPFARIANALHEEPPVKLKRPQRRSRPSFSDLAPVLPPTPTPPVLTHPPPVVVNRVEVLGSSLEPPRVNPLPFVPSVIVSEEPPVSRFSRPPPSGPTTLRVVRKEASPHHALSASTVLLLLAISLTVFGVGVAALFYSRSPTPRVNAADLPPPALSR